MNLVGYRPENRVLTTLFHFDVLVVNLEAMVL